MRRLSPVREEDLKTLPAGPYLIIDDCSEAGLYVQKPESRRFISKTFVIEDGHEAPVFQQDVVRFSTLEQLDSLLDDFQYQSVIHLAGSGLTDGILSQSSEELALFAGYPHFLCF